MYRGEVRGQTDVNMLEYVAYKGTLGYPWFLLVQSRDQRQGYKEGLDRSCNTLGNSLSGGFFD